MSLSYREFIECRYIGLFRISNSISYRTSHIEYLDILKTNDFFVFFRRKFQKIAENSENSPKIRRKFWKFAENSPKIQKIRRKFWKFAENSSKRRSSLRPSYRIVSYRIEKKTLISYRYRIESKKSLSLLSGNRSIIICQQPIRWFIKLTINFCVDPINSWSRAA